MSKLAFAMMLSTLLAIAPMATAHSENLVIDYVVTPDNLVIQVLRPQSDPMDECESIDASSTTPELIKTTGSLLNGWSFVQSDTSQGYVTWISEKSGAHTVFLANYLLRNCALSEIRYGQKTFTSDDRYNVARRAYNALIEETLGRQ